MNRIDANDYPQLLLLTWDRSIKTMTEEDAFALYQAKDKWVEPENMDPEELAFFQRLVDIYGHGVFLRKPSPMHGPLNNYGEHDLGSEATFPATISIERRSKYMGYSDLLSMFPADEQQEITDGAKAQALAFKNSRKDSDE